MISVLLLGSRTVAGRTARPGDAVRTLSALVPAAVDGVVRDVQLLATQPDPDLAAVAEHAGCALVAAELAQGLAQATRAARSPNLLLLLAGASFDRALADELAGVAARHPTWIGSGIALKAAEDGLWRRLLPRLAPTVGVLVSRDRLAGSTAATVPALWRNVRPRRVFKNRAWTGQED